MFACKASSSTVSVLTSRCLGGEPYCRAPCGGGGVHGCCACNCGRVRFQSSSLAGFTLENSKLKEGWNLCTSNRRLHKNGRPAAGGARARAHRCLATEATILSDTQTFYEVLGLAEDVALPDIKTAYRQMARRYHPDVCPPEELEENTKRFIEVQEAYETLSDSRRRAMYDAQILNFGSRKLWNLNDMDGVHWKRQWEGQLSGLQYRNATKDADSDSWGARMRRKVQEQQYQSSS
ncbi:unnamed protein product [Sphagnum jensenii]|uniref:J domain-containing protein n=1 Tax=Sphagnum jensenii TaxID=128206 RepID=A0ABP0X5H7_9BRYO